MRKDDDFVVVSIVTWVRIVLYMGYDVCSHNLAFSQVGSKVSKWLEQCDACKQASLISSSNSRSISKMNTMGIWYAYDGSKDSTARHCLSYAFWTHHFGGGLVPTSHIYVHMCNQAGLAIWGNTHTHTHTWCTMVFVYLVSNSESQQHLNMCFVSAQ